jgi:hypothetical protein
MSEPPEGQNDEGRILLQNRLFNRRMPEQRKSMQGIMPLINDRTRITDVAFHTFQLHNILN